MDCSSALRVKRGRAGSEDGVCLPHPSAYTCFVEWATDRGISLYPAQDEAVTELVSGANVIL